MKTVKYCILSLFCVSLLLVSCEDNAKDEEWGISLLYMPQSVLGDGGQTANLSIGVHTSQQSDTSIVVGMYRSGLAPIEAVTANLVIASDTLASAIKLADAGDDTHKAFKNAKLLPSDYYELPDNISLSDGQRENHVFIKLNKNKLFSDSHTGPFVLPVKLDKPTRYQLNEERSLTFFIFSKK
ncbi:DUF1735 domain-containing protein [Dysgonomonas gadei]|uniref:BT-3987-like N-terminal domain-containing protein n=1 Tax=Dysgonomonas gadei ATCC BAA-286 TaxID=742766 RepID=F5IWX2_9BACT|nr:DUF1735 domain-containing protein [Dysgonomonas gadei]EGK02319.1 hypothetical protein HMPREF9455_01589 [Dysgonomonas gadei ATCC BAA-286]